jgi:hypothetical protein
MSCKSLIDVATTTLTTVVENGIIPLATIIRRRGNEVNLNGNAISITDCGSNYYLVVVTATFTAPVAGVVTLNLQQNGSNVAGATASTTITTATTEVRSLSFPVIVRTFNNVGIDTLSLVNAGVGATFSNISIVVEKL